MRNESQMRAFCLLLSLTSLACCGPEVKRDPFIECGKVVQTVYMPAQHDYSTSINFEGRPQTTSNWSDPTWGVVFECAHGQFVVDGSSRKHKELWSKSRVGMRVQISSELEYTVDEKTGEKSFVGFSFVDAVENANCIQQLEEVTE